MCLIQFDMKVLQRSFILKSNWNGLKNGQRFGLQSGNNVSREHQLTNKNTLRIFRSLQEHPTFILKSETYRVRNIGTFGWSTNNIIWVIFRSKIAGKNFSNLLEWVFWNSENLKSYCPQTIKKKNTQWKCSTKTEERLALTLRLVHIPYNLLFHRHQNNQTHSRRQQHSCQQPSWMSA